MLIFFYFFGVKHGSYQIIFKYRVCNYLIVKLRICSLIFPRSKIYFRTETKSGQGENNPSLTKRGLIKIYKPGLKRIKAKVDALEDSKP